MQWHTPACQPWCRPYIPAPALKPQPTATLCPPLPRPSALLHSVNLKVVCRPPIHKRFDKHPFKSTQADMRELCCTGVRAEYNQARGAGENGKVWEPRRCTLQAPSAAASVAHQARHMAPAGAGRLQGVRQGEQAPCLHNFDRLVGDSRLGMRIILALPPQPLHPD